MTDLKTISAELEHRDVVFFLGAGMSKSAGIPTAAELVGLLPDHFKPQDISNPTLADIANFCDSEGRRPQLNTKIREIIQAAQDALTGPSPAHLALARLKNVNQVITTNWDTLLEDACKAPTAKRNYVPIAMDEDMGSYSHHPETLNILKMHGTLDIPSSYVISENDFARFPVKHSLFYRKLENIFIEYTVILVGYGLGDENVKYAYNNIRSAREIPRQVYAVDPLVGQSKMGQWRSHHIDVLEDGKGKRYDAMTFFTELATLI